MSEVSTSGRQIPPAGTERRAWIRFALQSKPNVEHGRPYNQADIARAADVSQGTVSLVYTGGRVAGDKAALVRKITANVLGIPESELFPEVAGTAPGEPGEAGKPSTNGSAPVSEVAEGRIASDLPRSLGTVDDYTGVKPEGADEVPVALPRSADETPEPRAPDEGA